MSHRVKDKDELKKGSDKRAKTKVDRQKRRESELVKR